MWAGWSVRVAFAVACTRGKWPRLGDRIAQYQIVLPDTVEFSDISLLFVDDVEGVGRGREMQDAV